MNFVRRFSFLCGACLSASVSGLFASQAPLLTLDFYSYDRLIEDAGVIAAAVGEDPAIVGMQAPLILGPGVIDLVDTAKPWHAAVWMQSLGAMPVVAIVLPIEDFEAFEAVVATSMLGQIGAQYIDTGDSVVLFGTQPGAILPDGWDAVVEAYVAGLELSPEQTIEVDVNMSEEIRAAAVAALALPKAQVMAAFEQPVDELEASGMTPEMMKGMMEAYFSFYETMLMDTASFALAFGVGDNDLQFDLSMTPVPGSGLADLVASQNVDVSDLVDSVDWSSGMAMVMGMGDLPESWQPLLDSMMQSLMPLYGLDASVAAEWTAVMGATLPFKGVYNISFEDGISFYGFYDILDASAADVYASWLTITEGLVSGGESVEPYYTDLKVEKGVREIEGHSVDRIEMTVNPEHPTMQLPEQKEMMEQLFEDGKVAYEMVLVDSRIYMATEGALSEAFKSEGRGESPIAVGPNTRFVGSMSFAEIFKMGAGLSGEPTPAALADADPADVRLSYSIEASDVLRFRSAFPLGIIEVFSDLEESQD